MIAWVAEHWKGEDWGANGSQRYMRALDDRGWQARMLGMQKMVALGEESVPVLTTALEAENGEMQIFAAQTFGHLASAAPTGALTDVLKNSPHTAARLYAADALGMRGGEQFNALFEAESKTQKDRDVKKHLGYALERAGAAVQPEVVTALTTWDGTTINSAEIGKPAPDFELEALNGGRIRLSQFRGKSAVVLVFIYGDT